MQANAWVKELLCRHPLSLAACCSPADMTDSDAPWCQVLDDLQGLRLVRGSEILKYHGIRVEQLTDACKNQVVTQAPTA